MKAGTTQVVGSQIHVLYLAFILENGRGIIREDLRIRRTYEKTVL
jgi:hypothetical protein